MSILDSINEANDIKKIPEDKLKELAREIRIFMIKKVSETGGHLASNLGAVELTMALHLFLDFPNDKLIFDVGHQCYTHKILTARKNSFDSLRQFGGLSGFPNMRESDCDAFNTGHSSTSISVADGIVKARDLNGENYKVVAVIGDGALSGGMAFEALNNAGRLKSNMIIVLNDNKMSISENVGGMATYLGRLRTSSKYTELKMNVEEALKKVPYFGEETIRKIKTSKDSIKSLVVPGMFFENMGITYIGPIDGHNIPMMLDAFKAAAKSNGPVLVHVITKKGKGYRPAEEDPSAFHGVDPFNCSTGERRGEKKKKSYTEVFGEKLIDIAEKDSSIVAVTAAMADGTGLRKFREKFPRRFFDVGIAEEHAVTFAAGMASRGIHPVVALYSTFAQRAYDQFIHDVALNRLPVTICIDRAGIVGCDGETHQGIFDLSYMSSIPGMTVMAPKSAAELEMMMEFACAYDGPVAIRYPRGKAYYDIEQCDRIEYGRSEVISRIPSGKNNIESNRKICIFAVGKMVKVMYNICSEVDPECKNITLVNARFVNPIDFDRIEEMAEKSDVMVTVEENVKRGGFGEAVASHLMEKGYKGVFKNISLADAFIKHGNPRDLRDSIGFDPKSIEVAIEELLR